MNEIDKKILKILQNNGRITNVEIARQINMAPSAVLERIRRLEKKNVIKKYSAVINPHEIKRNLLAFILVKANGPIVDNKSAKELAKIDEIQEVHMVAGEDCFLVKVRVENTDELSSLLRTKIAKIKSISSTSTTIVLETVKESSDISF